MTFSASNKDTILHYIWFGEVTNRQDAKVAKEEEERERGERGVRHRHPHLPAEGHKSARAQVWHAGLRALQTARPW